VVVPGLKSISVASLSVVVACSGNPYAGIHQYPQTPKSSPSSEPVSQLGCYGTGLLMVAVDSSGQIYVTEQAFERVVTISPDGATETVLSGGGGAANFGFLDGPGDSALFAGLQGLVVDAQGAVYVADTGNCRIRSIDRTGLTSTIAGNGCVSTDGGAAPVLTSPRGLALGPAGELYVADCRAVRMIDHAGNVVLLAEAPASECVDGIAIGPQGVLYVQAANRILRLDVDAGLVPFAGSGSPGFVDGPPDRAEFNGPDGLAVDGQGNLYVADVLNNRVRLVDPVGNVSTLAGNGGESVDGSGYSYVQAGSGGANGTAEFYEPTGVALDSASNVYVVSYQDACIGVIHKQAAN
jgi:sugar lactone lactonase YvrE